MKRVHNPEFVYPDTSQMTAVPKLNTVWNQNDPYAGRFP
jgi:hypothetical protein